MRAPRLKELEGMAAKLFVTARKLPPAHDRHNALKEIGSWPATERISVGPSKAEGRGK
jgi:hypothetical protein